MTNRSGDWLRQAWADLEHAELSLREGDFEWSCFACQQAAEKGLKGVDFHLHGDPWGHSLLALLQALPASLAPLVVPELLDAARALDKQYIQARYPNGFAMGAPMDYFVERDAQEAVSYARSIPHFCQAQVCEQA